MDHEPGYSFTDEQRTDWVEYLTHFKDNIYPMFKAFDVSFETALSVWFVNRLRNAIPDNDAGDEPWKDRS